VRTISDRYWVGGSATWDATAGTKWATTSGGAGGAAVPTSADDVFFDAASGASSVGVETWRVCRSLNTTGFTGVIVNGSGIYIGDASGGALTVGATMGSFTTPLQLQATTDNGGAGWPITTNGKTLRNVTFNGVGGKWILQDALTCGVFTVTKAGNFDTGKSRHVGQSRFISSNSNVRTISLGSSLIIYYLLMLT
jgi:hypothetical protein